MTVDITEGIRRLQPTLHFTMARLLPNADGLTIGLSVYSFPIVDFADRERVESTNAPRAKRRQTMKPNLATYAAILRKTTFHHAAWWMLCFAAAITPFTAAAGFLWKKSVEAVTLGDVCYCISGSV